MVLTQLTNPWSPTAPTVLRRTLRDVPLECDYRYNAPFFLYSYSPSPFCCQLFYVIFTVLVITRRNFCAFFPSIGRAGPDLMYFWNDDYV